MTESTAPTASLLSIAEFAVAVRAELSDLPADDVDELTGGLEADLTEQAADATEAGAASPELGAPVAYAAELRAAADLPPRTEPAAGAPRESVLRRLGTRARTQRADAARSIRQSPAGAQLLDFLLVLRPVWWVLRGWAVYAVAEIFIGRSVAFLPTDPFRTIFLLALVTLSVQWGRGRWLPWRWLTGLRTLVSVCAVVALPLLLLVAAHQLSYQNTYAASSDSYISPGLVQNGEQVTNIFAYDSAGQPLPDVQLFDQDGQPLGVLDDSSNTPYLSQYDEAGTEHVLVPSRRVPGGSGWNVYPLGHVTSDDVYSRDALAPLEAGEATPFPFTQVQPLVAVSESAAEPESGESTGETTPSPSPSAAPTASATEVPTPTLTDAGVQQ